VLSSHSRLRREVVPQPPPDPTRLAPPPAAGDQLALARYDAPGVVETLAQRVLGHLAQGRVDVPTRWSNAGLGNDGLSGDGMLTVAGKAYELRWHYYTASTKTHHFVIATLCSHNGLLACEQEFTSVLGSFERARTKPTASRSVADLKPRAHRICATLRLVIRDIQAYERDREAEYWQNLAQMSIEDSIALGETLLMSEMLDPRAFADDDHPLSLAISLGIAQKVP